MTATTYDPFTWRLAELEVADAPCRRRLLEQDLLVAEAEEVALGRRHLTIVHGEPLDPDEAADLDAFYDAVFEVVEAAEWCRVRGTLDWVTVTVAGARRDDVLIDVVHLVSGRWRLVESPVPL